MISATVLALALLAIDARQVAPPPTSADDPFRGSGERVTPPRHIPSAGMNLETLHGLPRFRPVLVPQQPQVIYYPIYVYPVYGYNQGLGGYVPPGTGGYRRWGGWWGW